MADDILQFPMVTSASRPSRRGSRNGPSVDQVPFQVIRKSVLISIVDEKLPTAMALLGLTQHADVIGGVEAEMVFKR